MYHILGALEISTLEHYDISMNQDTHLANTYYRHIDKVCTIQYTVLDYILDVNHSSKMVGTCVVTATVDEDKNIFTFHILLWDSSSPT